MVAFVLASTSKQIENIGNFALLACFALARFVCFFVCLCALSTTPRAETAPSTCVQHELSRHESCHINHKLIHLRVPT